MPPPIDPRVAKLLGDLLALTLSENLAQAEAAIGAIRRRAARDSITGGALKQLVDQLLAQPTSEQVSYLRWTIEDQRRELEQARQARHQAEAALANSQGANESLAISIGALNRSRRTGWKLGTALGAGGGLICGGLLLLMLRSAPAGPGLDRLNRAVLNDHLRSCFMSNTNSLGGAEFPVHLLLDIDADGRIARAQVAPDQAALLNDTGHGIYAAMVLRTLGGGSCGSLPLPSSLRGKASRIDLVLSR